jgi:hypothetical protein
MRAKGMKANEEGDAREDQWQQIFAYAKREAPHLRSSSLMLST